MCKFFSCDSDGVGNIFYFNAIQRKEIKGEYEPDSHTSIADYYGFKGKLEDKLNKYEFNPLTKTFVVDQLNTTDDSELVKQKCLELNFKEIVPELIIKPIINPFIDRQCEIVTDEDIELLREWALISDSVRNSVENSVENSIRDSIMDSVRDSVGYSVRDSVWDSIMDSVRDSVGYSVENSVWDSVRESVCVYISSFFSIKYAYNFTSTIKLWEKGLVPSFDGKKWRLQWRLHGYKGKVVWEGKI